MHLFLWAEDSEAKLRSELSESFPAQPAVQSTLVQAASGGGSSRAHELHAPTVIAADFQITPGQRLPHLALARQLVPHALPVRAESVRDWANRLCEAIAGVLPDDQPWSLHIEPHYHVPTAPRIGARAWHSRTRNAGAPGGSGKGWAAMPAQAGRQRCRLIGEALMELLQRKRRHLLRNLRREPVPFTARDSLVQLLLTAPDAGFISVAPAPMPFEQRHLVSPFPKGDLPVASDKTAPSRAFAKLLEAEKRLGRAIQAGEACVDLGAAPGSWTYVALSRGARVIAVDRSPLREDLMRSPQVEFQSGDAFRFQPRQPVDWLLCDVIAAPERTAALLLDWVRRGWCRHFIVTLKLGEWQQATPRRAIVPASPNLSETRSDQGSQGRSPSQRNDALAMLKRELPPLTRELWLTRLCANKREVCAFGSTNTAAANTSI